ncbi:MAG: SIMPL domain-containing protein [Brevefilum sp.]
MKKTSLLLLTLLALAAFISGCVAAPAASDGDSTRTMDVSGSGTVELSPDIARVNIGVRSQSPDVAQALEENNATGEAIIQALMDLGVEQNDIQTRNFNVFPQSDRQPEPEGEVEETQTFVVENTVSATVRDPDSLGEVLSTVIQEGANTIHGVSFDVEDRESAVEEARGLAIEDARAQAQAIAETTEISLGPIQSISINAGGSGDIPRAEQMEALGGGDVPISGGQLSIRVTANLTYEIE